jgi:outer membrane protein OmpA-like peptidoglycan-associated protein
MMFGLWQSTATRVRADEPWLLDGELSVGLPITTPQRDWFGVGGSLALGVQRPLTPWFALAARLRTAGFLDGDQPENPGVKDPGFGTLNIATLGVAFRLPDGTARRATGLWVEGNGGGGFTGKKLRPTLDAAIGYGFAVGQRSALAPLVRYVQVFQSDDNLSAADARLLLVGLRASFLDREPERVPVVVPPPEVEIQDRDGDGILNDSDKCPDTAEDKDGFEDEDGCPEADNDQDGIIDESDGCPNMAEDKDGFEDDDGCPDDDNDRDGVLDEDDTCPLEQEVINGVDDQDGCPDKGLIVMHDDRIVLEERVLFDVMRARVKSSAQPVLEAIVALWKQHPEWMKVRIEGHADVRGDANFNQKLSERRAANVRDSLIKLGFNPELVTAEGFGASRLLTTGTAEEDHRTNRRVEFVVMARYGDEGAPDLPPPTSAAPAPAAQPEPAPAEPSKAKPDAEEIPGSGAVESGEGKP